MFAALKILSLVWSNLIAKIKSPKKIRANKLEVMIQIHARNLELTDTNHKVCHLFILRELTKQTNLSNRLKTKKVYGFIKKILRRIQFLNWIN